MVQTTKDQAHCVLLSQRVICRSNCHHTLERSMTARRLPRANSTWSLNGCESVKCQSVSRQVTTVHCSGAMIQSLMMNMRSGHGQHQRAVAIATDLGVSWTPLASRFHSDRTGVSGQHHPLYRFAVTDGRRIVCFFQILPIMIVPESR